MAKSNLSTPLVPHLHPSELAWSYIAMEGDRRGGGEEGRGGGGEGGRPTEETEKSKLHEATVGQPGPMDYGN